MMIRSAPARLIDVRISFITRGPSIHPRSAAAFTIEYSPLTLYAATGRSKLSRFALMTSRI